MINNKSRGKAAAKYFIDAAGLGIASAEVSDDIVIRRFAHYCEAIPIHQIQMPRGTLLLLAPDNGTDTGAIYFYDRSTKKFYDLCFEEGADNDIGLDEFQKLVGEYELKSIADNSQPQYLGELLFAYLQPQSSWEDLSEFAAAWLTCQPPKRHLDEFDA